MAVYDFIEQSTLGAGFVYKNQQEAYVYSTAQFIITTGTGTNTVNISSVVSGTVIVGMTVSGGTLSGTKTISSFGTFNGTSGTVVLSGTETFANPTTVNGAGFIKVTDGDYPASTVRGIVYLDGTYYVMTPDASIYGSALENPFSWTALNVIQALGEPDKGIALYRQLNLIVAFGEYSTEFFYDAGNATGSPLLPYQSAFLELGCASADSIAQAENTLYFIGKARQKGRAVYMLNGTQPQRISTAFVDKMLDADNLGIVNAYFIRTQGHGFYILSLVNSNQTLIYDTTTTEWSRWTQLYLSDSLSPLTAASWADGLVTATYAAHGLDDGDFAVISSSNPSGYDYSGAVNVISANIFTYRIAADPGLYVGSANLDVYKETLFDLASYVKFGNTDLVQDSTTGTVYAVDTGEYQDNGLPIRYQIQTSKVDGGSNKEKYFARFELIGDKFDGTCYVRYTNDDYQTWSQYSPVDMDAQRSQLYRQGRGRRRAYDVINYDNAPVRLEAMEITANEGVR